VNVLRVKPGVQFTVIAPAGFRLLGALDTVARRLKVDLTITCGTEAHPSTDPHSTGEAYDVRTHDLTDDQKRAVLRELLLELSDDQTADTPMIVSDGLGTRGFWGWIENPGMPAEHIHVQRRQRTVYPPAQTPGWAKGPQP
jgi:hypothetical protein